MGHRFNLTGYSRSSEGTSSGVSFSTSRGSRGSAIGRVKTAEEILRLAAGGERRSSSNILRGGTGWFAQFDTNGDGAVDDDETINYIMNRRKLNKPFNQKVYWVNRNAREIKNIIESVDQIADGEVDTTEVVEAILRDKRMASPFDAELNRKVLNTNPNYSEYQEAIGRVDADDNGVIDNLETLGAILDERRGEASFNGFETRVLEVNNLYQGIRDVIDHADPDLDGQISDRNVFDFVLAERANDFDAETDVYDLIVSASPNGEAIANSIEVFDADNDGDITRREYIDSINLIRRGIEDQADHQALLDILNDDPRYAGIWDTLAIFDRNGDGTVSDIELIRGMLDLRAGVVENPVQEIIDDIYAAHDHTDVAQKIVEVIDLDGNGGFDKDDILDAFLATVENENTTGTKDLRYDFNNDGDVTMAEANMMRALFRYSIGDPNFNINV